MPNSAQLSPAQLARRVDAISYDGGPGGARQMSYSFESAGGSGLPWGGIVSGYAGWSAAGREAVLAALDHSLCRATFDGFHYPSL